MENTSDFWCNDLQTGYDFVGGVKESFHTISFLRGIWCPMTPISIDQNLDAYIFGCPVCNEEARGKLEHMGLEVPDKCACEKKQECCPAIGRIYRVARDMLS